MHLYFSTNVKSLVKVADRLVSCLRSNKSRDSIRKGCLCVILCLLFIFSASGVLVPRTVQAGDGGYLFDRVIEWSDGSSEHVQIGNDGFFRLDGVKKRLVGFDLGIGPSYNDVDRYWLPENLALMDKTLAYMESVGVRIITFNPRYLGTWNEMGNEDVIYPEAFDLIYNHKMLVIPHLVTNYLPGADNFETLPWSWSWFDWTDDTTSFLTRAADAIKDYPNIVACILGNELNKPMTEDWWTATQPPQTYSPEQAANFFNYTRNIVAPKLPNIPIVQNLVGCATWWETPPEIPHPDIMEAILPVTDHPCCTMYGPSLDFLDFSINTYLTWLSGMGYPTVGWWIEEFNKVEGGGVADFTVDYLEHAFNYGASIILLHASISPDDPRYSFFDTSGNPIDSLVAIGGEMERLQAPISEPTTAPTVITTTAVNITNGAATLNGNLDGLGTAETVNVSFEWGLTTTYGDETTSQAMTATGPFSFNLSGLSPNTIYHFRAKAVGEGTSYGSDMSFTTSGAEGVTVSINAPAEDVLENSDFTASIDISGVGNFDAANYNVCFDASVLQLTDVTSGQVESTEIPVDIWNEINSGMYAIVQNVPGISAVSGSGYLAVLHFQVVGAEGQTSEISLSNVVLSNNLAQEIPAMLVGDSVRVISVVAGDANGDRKVDALDITKAERIIAQVDAATPGADANQDGAINALDITKTELLITQL